MSEWKKYRLGEIASFTTGKLNSNAAITDGRYPFFTCAPAPLYIDVAAFNQEAVILAGNNAEGNFAINYYNGEFNAYQRTYVFTARNNLSTKFLYYSLSQFLKDFKVLSRGTATKFLTASILNSFKLSLPPIAIQQKIADILSSLDEKIETNRKINARLEALAQAIFKSWFIDFEPFGVKMPDNWQTGALSNIAQIIMGQSPSGESINNQQEGMIFYQGKSEFGERFPSVKNYTSNITRIAPQNSILLSVRAPVGDVNITLNQCCIGRGIASINYKDGSNSYLYLLLKSKSDYFDIFDNGGTVFGSINKKGLEEMPIIIPSSSTIKEFNEIISPIDKEIERRYNESTRLASLRDTLLPKLMSGELIPE